MQGDVSPTIRKVKAGTAITEQGAEEDDVFLVLDGVVSVEVDGEVLVELGPGALLGERALLEGGKRTSTLRAVTACKLAVVSSDHLDRSALEELSKGHRRRGEVGREEIRPATFYDRSIVIPSAAAPTATDDGGKVATIWSMAASERDGS